jgi:type II secretion system protein H
VFGKSKKQIGFSLIEILVVIMIIGVMATIVVPNLLQQAPGYKRKQFVTELNALMAITWEHALSTNQLHRVLFDFDTRTIKIEVETKQDEKGKTTFQNVSGVYRKTTYTWDKNLEIREFIVEGLKESKKIDKIWIFVTPEGLGQDVIINIVDVGEQKEVPLGLVLNPFIVQFKVYDTFQKP